MGEAIDLIVYLHIPKTAGTSMLTAFRHVYGEDTIWMARPWLKAGCPDIPRHVKVLFGHITCGIHQFTDRKCVYVTMLRDPVARVVSSYFYRMGLTGDSRRMLRWRGMHDGMNLREFALSNQWVTVDNLHVRQLSGRVFRHCPVARRVDYDDYGRAFYNLKHFAAVGIVEEYTQSLGRFANALGWDTLPPVVRENARDHPGLDELDPATLEMIKHRNVYDFSLYHHYLRAYRGVGT